MELWNVFIEGKGGGRSCPLPLGLALGFIAVAFWFPPIFKTHSEIFFFCNFSGFICTIFVPTKNLFQCSCSTSLKWIDQKRCMLQIQTTHLSKKKKQIITKIFQIFTTESNSKKKINDRHSLGIIFLLPPVLIIFSSFH